MQLQHTNTYIADRDDLQGQLIEQWLKLKQGKTQKDYRKNIKKFFDFLGESNHQDVRPHVVTDYKLYLQARNLKPSTVNTYLAPVKDFFEWCYEMDYLHYNAAKYVTFIKKSSQHVKKARSLSMDEVSLLLAEASEGHLRHYMALCMLFNLGLRVSELTNIKLKHINFEQSTVVILGKGSKVRELGINGELMALIRKCVIEMRLHSEDYLVQSAIKHKNEAPMASYSISRIIKKYAVKAGISTDGISTHSGRVTAINHLLDNEVSMRDVANFAGHSDINTTRCYDRKQREKIIQTSKIINFS